MKKTSKNFPMVLIGKQVLEGEVQFKDAVKLVKDKKEFMAFKKEIEDNCIDMWGEGCVISDKFTIFCDCFEEDGSYEKWVGYPLNEEDTRRIEIN